MRLSDKCSLIGGASNEGFIALRVRAAERDLAGVSVIRFTARLMHQPRGGGSWDVHQTQVRAVRSTSARTWTGSWNFGGDVHAFRHHIDMTVDFMTSNGAIVAARGVFGSAC